MHFEQKSEVNDILSIIFSQYLLIDYQSTEKVPVHVKLVGCHEAKFYFSKKIK